MQYNEDIPLNPDPIQQFLAWYDEAVRSGIKNPEAMTLATASPIGIPAARIVLYKGMDTHGLRFYTNYQSRKGRELEINPHAALVFYWPNLDRQVRIEGRVVKLSLEDSEAYWNSRPRPSQIGGLASPQSEILLDRKTLEKRCEELDRIYKNLSVPRPEHWGGYCLIPDRFEFWLAGDYRIHDRFAYSRSAQSESLGWKVQRLAP